MTNQLIFGLLYPYFVNPGGSTDGVSSPRFLNCSNSLSHFLSLSTVFFFFSFFFAALCLATVHKLYHHIVNQSTLFKTKNRHSFQVTVDIVLAFIPKTSQHQPPISSQFVKISQRLMCVYFLIDINKYSTNSEKLKKNSYVFINMTEPSRKITEHNELIATRVPPGDRWTIINDSRKIIYSSITDVLESYFNQTQFRGEYRLSPLESKLFVIKTIEEEIKPEPPKKLNLYGDKIE